ncbi:MAG TPA: hypothetical protein VGU23_03795, partial [Acidobacteriaceae bacterium]|nr:hypothetical protein [Acidobacteriaceae bacterium]
GETTPSLREGERVEIAATEEVAKIPKENDAMLDVHAPHETVHTWKDAFIHIGIICVGLLLAIGLENLVEHFHNEHLVKATRERLRQERAYDCKRFSQFSGYIRWVTVEYENDMQVLVYLQQHPGTPQEKLPGILNWEHNDNKFSYSAWETAQQRGVTALMPQDEVAADAKLYNDLHLAEDMSELEFTAAHQAEAYMYQDRNPSHLTPAEVTDEIKMVRTLLMQHERYMLAMRLIDIRYPDFTGGPADADLSHIRNAADQQTQTLLAPATKLTVDRMKAAGWVAGRVSTINK